MIFGSFGKATGQYQENGIAWQDWGLEPQDAPPHFLDQQAFLALTLSGAASHDAGHLLHTDRDRNITVALYGNIFNYHELSEALGLETNGKSAAAAGDILVTGYVKWGTDLFLRANGNFVLAIHDPGQNRFWIARDHLGVESLYYYRKESMLYFSSNLNQLAHHPRIQADLNPTAILRYFLFNYNPALDTFFKDIYKLRPGYVLRIENDRMMLTPYWYISFKEQFEKDIDTYRQELLELFRDAIRIRLDADRFRTGAYLSGGMDSSTVVGLMRPMVKGPLHTFSFRCRGKSYDESAYARLMSERYQTQHHEVPYEAADVERIVELVEHAQEPFSDIGIEVASYLLAEKASGVVDYVLTGDGGDELFGGHPVYLADRMASKFEKIPAFIRKPLTQLLQKLPDTDQKKSLPVKAKRFSYSVQFPAALYSNRWRIYYTPQELQQLLTGDWKAAAEKEDPLAEILSLYSEADGEDYLSKSLYGDYYTVVGFYLRRMELVRRFGLEGRFPLLDHRLVEYTAHIPSNLKIDASGATKYIFHQVMAGVLPDEIVFRKDKLGHSVPFKNWLRNSPQVRELMQQVLSEETLKKRGWVNPQFVQTLLQRHLSKADNHSHRLWAILVLELWCQKHLDRREKVETPQKDVA
ncbi:MAG: asparagine synthase-related protein [candidate division KSB1 bacterium]|nr:asparagine synthase-related protein [candidate division KSB1 bacterium]MDQ7063009.1 asparagine synthase-related protein [candidate division KSB1 bacterium]